MSKYPLPLSALLFVALATCPRLALSQDFGSGAVVQPKPDLKEVRIDQKLGASAVLDASLKDRQGTPLQFRDTFHQRPVLLLPIFYRCQGVCTLEFENLVASLPKMTAEKVGKDFDVVVLSIDPQEGPKLAQEKFDSTFSENPDLKGSEKGWHFLTGDLADIRKVTDSVGFYYTYDASNDIINHPSGIVFLSPTGKIASYILGANYTPASLTSSLRLAAKEQVGQKSQDVFFGCVHIDPLTGKRSIAVEGVMRILAGATVVALLLTIVAFSVKSKRRHEA